MERSLNDIYGLLDAQYKALGDRYTAIMDTMSDIKNDIERLYNKTDETTVKLIGIERDLQHVNERVERQETRLSHELDVVWGNFRDCQARGEKSTDEKIKSSADRLKLWVFSGIIASCAAILTVIIGKVVSHL